jgi:hypothetical protein
VLDLVDPTGPGGRLGGQCGNARLDKANRKNAARDHDGEIAARPGQQQPSHCRTSIGQPPLPIALMGPWRVDYAGRHHAWGAMPAFGESCRRRGHAFTSLAAQVTSCRRHSYSSLASGLRKQRVQRGIDECIVGGIHPEACRMPPDRRDGPQFGIRHLRHFKLIVTHPKVKVCLTRHDDGPRPDGAKRSGKIPVESRIRTNVGVLPCPQHR